MDAALLAVCAVLVAWQLFVPPSLGVADNNDFPKLMGRYCLGPESPKEYRLFDWASFCYKRDSAACWDSGLVSSAVLPMRVALVATGREHFDLRVLGAVYAVLFLLAVYALLRIASPITVAAAILVFACATYVPWFSTFYFDTAAFVFLLLSVATVSRIVLCGEVRPMEYAAAVLCVALFAASKAQHTPLALCAIPCLWCSFGREVFPARWVRGVGSAVVVAVSAAMFATAPAWYQTTNLFNALFYQCLPRSADAAADLAGFGFEASMRGHVGQHAFTPDSPVSTPQQAASVGRHLTMSSMVRYYATHPRVAWLVFLNAMNEGSLQRVRMKVGEREYRLGNYERSTGRPAEAQSRFLDVWSVAKERTFGRRPLLYLAYAVALFAALCWRAALRGRRAILLAATLNAMAVLAALIVMFDGVDTGRHLFVFNALLDVAVCALIATAIPSGSISRSAAR